VADQGEAIVDVGRDVPVGKIGVVKQVPVLCPIPVVRDGFLMVWMVRIGRAREG
jgi:hypothetical protein